MRQESDNLHFPVLNGAIFSFARPYHPVNDNIASSELPPAYLQSPETFVLSPLVLFNISFFRLYIKYPKCFSEKSIFVLAIPCLIREVSPIDVIPNAQHNSVFP